MAKLERAARLPSVKVDLCTCENEYQDKTYGKGRRVYNICVLPKGMLFKGYRCTVCGVKRDT